MLGLLWSLGKVAFVGCIALHTHMHVTIVVPTHEVTFMHRKAHACLVVASHHVLNTCKQALSMLLGCPWLGLWLVFLLGTHTRAPKK